MKVFGKAPINKIVYLTGKFLMYFVWIIGILQLIGYNVRLFELEPSLIYFIILFALIGLLIAIISMLNLGNSLRFGIPNEKIAFKTNGLYALSRNPMYLGFFIMEISAMIITFNPLTLVFGIYAICVHHLVVVSEEKYLKKTFGKAYEKYCKRVRRYI